MTEQNFPEYGTAEYYKNLFMDILGDLGDEAPTEKREAVTRNILHGFELALIDWMKYYEQSAQAFRVAHGKYIRGEFTM